MLAVTRPPHLVIPGFPPPSSPTSLLRHPRPRSGTYALVILAPDPKPIIPPSFRPSSRYPWAGRGNHHNHHPPHPHPSTVVPAKERHPVPRYGAGTQGTGAATPQPSSPRHSPSPLYRRAGVGRYPGDGRGKHHYRHPPPTPPHRHSTRKPVPRERARLPPQPSTSTYTCHPRRTPSCRRRPVPRGRARQPPQPSTSTYTCHPPANTGVPA